MSKIHFLDLENLDYLPDRDMKIDLSISMLPNFTYLAASL